MMRKFYVGLICIALLLTAGLLQAQTSNTGQVAGNVLDPTGAVVAGAKVTLTSDAGVKREITSDATGRYVFPLLPPGVYNVEVVAPNFASAKLTNVIVRITETTPVNVPLKVVAAQQETVEVTAQASLVNSESATNGRVIEQQTMRQLPLPTRNFQQLLALTPGAVGPITNSSELGRGDSIISVNGNRTTSNAVVINGVDAGSIGTNSTPNLAVPTTDSLQEFIVQTSLYDSSQGRSSGGIVAAVTKSGTNQYHGNMYEFLRNDALNANSYFLKRANIERPEYKRNQFGGTFGGPIKKDRAWFFLSYQGTRETNGTSLTNSLATVFTPGDLTNDRSTATLTSKYAAGSYIPGYISPVSLAILQAKLPNGQYLIPSANVNTGSSKPVATTLADTSEYREDQANGNIDYKLSNKNHISAKFFWANNPATQALYNFAGTGNALQTPGNPTSVDIRNRVLSLQDTHVISSHMINEARFGWNSIKGIIRPDEPFKASDFGITSPLGALYAGAPLISISNMFDAGASPLADNISDVATMSFYDTLSWTRGRHNLKFGGEFRRQKSDLVFNAYTRGQMVYSSFAQFLGGVPTSSIIGSGVTDRQNAANDFSFFLQDDWRVSDRLTLNLGVRYDVYGAFKEDQGRYIGFDPARATTVAIPGGVALTGGLVQAGNGSLAGIPKVSDGLVDTDWNNFGPRIGFSFRPFADNNKVVVRGGYGMYFDRPNARLYNSQVFASPYYSIAIAGAGITTIGGTNYLLWPNSANPFIQVPTPDKYPLALSDTTIYPFGGLPMFSSVSCGFAPLAALQFQGVTNCPGAVPSTGVYPNLHNFRTPYVQQYNLGFQWEFANNYLLDMSFVGASGTKLDRLSSLNTISGPTASSATAPFYPALSPYSNAIFGTYAMSSDGRSNYNSLQTSVTKRYSNGLQFLASYTWSHSIDDYSGGDVNDLVGMVGEQSHTHYFATSDFDRRHRVVMSAVYDLPKFYKGGNGFAKGAVNNWQLASIATWQSGTPFSIIGYNVGIVSSSYADLKTGRTNDSASKDGSVDGRLGSYFDTSAYQLPTSGWGNAGRNVLRGPDQRNLDLSIVKFFPIKESQKLEFRTEFFNLFNTTNFANPVNVFTSASFGQVVKATTGPRVVQFGLKYNF